MLTRLFGEQFTKDKKRTFMVLLSLAASLSVYLCVVTMLDSQAARTIVSNFMDSDLTGWNGSIVESMVEGKGKQNRGTVFWSYRFGAVLCECEEY